MFIFNLLLMEKMKSIAQALPLVLGLLFTGISVKAEVLETSTLMAVNQQVTKVTGTVVDGEGYPLIGVNVFEKGHQNNGAITNVDGNFTLYVSAQATLIFSYVGYKTQEVQPVDMFPHTTHCEAVAWLELV